jgi:MFS transporter, NNP family, nitrate/nitrite transporter
MLSIFSFSPRYKILHLTWIAFFLSFLVWFSFAPFAIAIQHELGLTSEQIKTLATCNLALTIPARIIIGMILDRWGARITFAGVLGFALIPCLMTGFANNFHQLVWSSLTMGVVGAGFVVGVRMVAEWFPPQKIGIAQGIYGGWGNFGAAASQLFLPSLAVATAIFTGGNINWRFAISSMGVVCAVYAVIYWCNVRDTPPGKEFHRPLRHGAMEVTSIGSFWGMALMDFGLLFSLGLLSLPLHSNSIKFLNDSQVILIWVGVAGLYLFQFYKSWQVNRELIGSLNPFAQDFLKCQRSYPPSQRYEFRQIALLSFTYLTNFGSQIAVVSVLPTFFAHTFNLNLVQAGFVAASFPFLNLISRPSGGLISDRLGSRKWVMTVMTGGIGLGYLLMANINNTWSISYAIASTIFCAYFVQAAAGATFSMVPLIKKEITGQIAGNVGAYGNVGGVMFLTIYNFTNTQTLFNFMGITGLICASLCGFFLKEPRNSFGKDLDQELVVEKPQTVVVNQFDSKTK